MQLTQCVSFKIFSNICCCYLSFPFARRILNVHLFLDFNRSNLFRHAPSDVVEILKSERVTANYHGFCVTEEASVFLLQITN